jgi:hypothetical protein
MSLSLILVIFEILIISITCIPLSTKDSLFEYQRIFVVDTSVTILSNGENISFPFQITHEEVYQWKTIVGNFALRLGGYSDTLNNFVYNQLAQLGYPLSILNEDSSNRTEKKHELKSHEASYQLLNASFINLYEFSWPNGIQSLLREFSFLHSAKFIYSNIQSDLPHDLLNVINSYEYRTSDEFQHQINHVLYNRQYLSYDKSHWEGIYQIQTNPLMRKGDCGSSRIVDMNKRGNLFDYRFPHIFYERNFSASRIIIYQAALTSTGGTIALEILYEHLIHLGYNALMCNRRINYNPSGDVPIECYSPKGEEPYI